MIAEHIQMEVEFDLEIISSELMNDSTVISIPEMDESQYYIEELSFLQYESEEEGNYVYKFNDQEEENDDSLLNLTLEYVHIKMIEKEIKKNRILDFMNESYTHPNENEDDDTCCGFTETSFSGISLRSSKEKKFISQISL